MCTYICVSAHDYIYFKKHKRLRISMIVSFGVNDEIENYIRIKAIKNIASQTADFFFENNRQT